MSILINKETIVLIQGITGKEGSRAARGMLSYGTNVVAGVTPGKGGQKTEDGLPVYNTVAEAVKEHPDVNATLIAVPPAFVFDAVAEAIQNKIPLIDILTEKVPVAQVAKMIALAKKAGVRIIGPSSVGILSPGQSKIGSIGSSELVYKIFSPGPIGVISKSGGMTAELSRVLTDAGLGQSTIIGIGGDVLIGSDFVDIALEFEKDPDTKAIVIFGEVGGTYEEQLAEAIAQKKITKPVVALIAGRFSEQLPQDTVLGHAGAIVNKGQGSASSKMQALREVGSLIATTPEDIPVLLKEKLNI